MNRLVLYLTNTPTLRLIVIHETLTYIDLRPTHLSILVLFPSSEKTLNPLLPPTPKKKRECSLTDRKQIQIIDQRLSTSKQDKEGDTS